MMSVDDVRPSLILATQNQKKKRELVELIESEHAGAWRVVTLNEIGLADLEIVEDKDTFAGNAELKVDAIAAALSSSAPDLEWAAILADDSGLCVDALDGGPGVRSARFASDNNAGEGDDANNALLVEKLRSVDKNERGARYVCFIAVRPRHGETFIEQGEVVGDIALTPKGSEGFGYDPYFVPVERPEIDGVEGVSGRHMAELSPSEKHSISHRGRATRLALARLRNL